MKKVGFLSLAVVTIFVFSSIHVFADCSDETKYKGEIVAAEELKCEGIEDEICIEYQIEISEGEIISTTPISTAFGYSRYSIGDKVYVSSICGPDEKLIWGIEGYSRESAIFWLLGIFVGIVLFVSGRKGAGSLLGLISSFVILYFVMIPLSVKTGNILLWGLLSVIFVLILSVYFSHGFNRQSTIALVCTFLGIAIISILSLIFISSTKLTGFGNEEMYMLLSQLAGGVNIKQILFLSMLISGIGVLDDVTVSQIGTIAELAKANPQMTPKELYKSSMNIGKDHVASMVNTLFIAYAGSSLSLIMLMNANGTTGHEVINNEFFAEDIVRATVSSMGLVLIVPISSYIGSFLIPKLIQKKKL